MMTGRLRSTLVSTMVACASLIAGAARADGVRTYDASLGTTPEQQGFGNTFGFGFTHRGITQSQPTVISGALHSDTTGTPGSNNGHQFWFEYSDLYCDFHTGVNVLEFIIKVNSSTYREDASYIRTGWNATLGDGHDDSSPSNLFQIGLTDTGYFIATDSQSLANPPAATPHIRLRPFNTTNGFHDYKMIVTKDGGRFYIDGVLRETIAPLWGPDNPFNFGFAVFGDGNGLPGLNVTSNTDLKLFKYGCMTAPPPTITCPADQTLECTAGGAIASFAPTVDGHGLTTNLVCTPPAGQIVPLGIGHVSCTATSDAGSASCGFNVKVQDTLPPVVTTRAVDLPDHAQDGKDDDRPLWPFHLSDCVVSVKDQCAGALDISRAGVGLITRIEWWPNIDVADAGDAKKRSRALRRSRRAFDRAGCGGFTMTGNAGALLPFTGLGDGHTAGSSYRVYFTATDPSGNATAASCTLRLPDESHGDGEGDHGQGDQHVDPVQPLACAVCAGTGCGACPLPATACGDDQQ